MTDAQAKPLTAEDVQHASELRNNHSYPNARWVATIEALQAEIEGEREARNRLDNALRAKDAAMGELFKRLSAAGVDYSDLLS